MSNYAAGTKLSELSLADAPTSPTNSTAPDALHGTRLADGTLSLPVANIECRDDAESVDKFLAQATREFEAGKIDQPLWVRAMVQAGGDAALAKPAYLRARATALRVAKRDQRADRRNRNADTLRNVSDRSRDVGSAKRKRMIMITGAIGFLVAVAGGLASMGWESAPVQQSPVATAAPRASASKPATPGESTKPVVASAGSAERHAMSGDDFAGKVRELKDAGNWNVLVLYAVEWTRKQPANAQAWKELGIGYATLRQFDDALEATTRAVRLAPEDFELWQTLGQINVTLAQPAKALIAFERAADLNGRDVTSLVQAGMLNAELGHLPQARDAFAKALAVSPRDVDALCGAASIAQKEGRLKEAEAFVREVKSIERVCRDSNAGESVAVATGTGAKKKPVSSGAR